MPFYPELPMANRYVDPLTAGVTGLGVGMEIGNQALKSRMYGEALAEQREKRRALQEYGQTGDVGKLMTVAPEVGVKMQEAQAYQQKVQLEAIKPGLDLAYMLSDGMTPENFQERRAAVTKLFPPMDAMLPKAYDEKQMQSLRQNYEKKFKLEQPTNWIYNAKTGQYEQAPGPGRISVIPDKSPIAREHPVLDEEGNIVDTITSTGAPVKLPRTSQAKPINMVQVRNQAATEVDKTFKWKDEKDNYIGTAEDELLTGKTFPHATYKGFGPTEQVPYDKLTPEEQTKVYSTIKPQIDKRAKEMFDKDRHDRVQSAVDERVAAASEEAPPARGGGRRAVTAPQYPKNYNHPQLGTLTRTDEVDPATGKPVYVDADGNKKLPK